MCRQSRQHQPSSLSRPHHPYCISHHQPTECTRCNLGKGTIRVCMMLGLRPHILVAVTVVLFPTLASALIPEVLYESSRILAIDKPAGTSHHNDDDTGELGIVTQLREFYQNNNNDSRDDVRLYGVHRLDRVTSGILLFAKDPEMAGILSTAFRDKKVVKYYVGISNRKPKKKKQGWVKGNMVRGRRKSWYLEQDEGSNSHPNYASTRFFTAGLGGLASQKRDENRQPPATCILFRPHTGKTHQLRVAAKSVGLPLMGDPIYSDPAECSRTLLHATAIHLPLEDEADAVTIVCPPPFRKLLWNDTVDGEFDQILDRLLQKHCECPEILSEVVSKEEQRRACQS